MKLVISFTLSLFVSLSLFAQNNFHVTGTVKGVSSGYIYLKYPSPDGKPVKDSTIIDAKGKFSFKGNIAHPVMVGLTTVTRVVDDSDPNVSHFFISPGKTIVTAEKDKFQTIQISGSPVENENKDLRKSTATIDKKIDALTDKFRKEKDKDKAQKIRDEMLAEYEGIKKATFAWFKKHPSSYVTAFFLQGYVSDFSLEELENYYAGYNAAVKKSAYGVNLKEEIEKLKGGSPGAVAKDFSTAGLNGDMVTLSSFKQQKYVLLDFWASWCVPCRKGNPHLKELYSKYKDKGFEIVGVSDDDGQPEKWKKAVKEDDLPWVHVLRGLDWEKVGKGEKNEKDINKKYGIYTLPTKILIDKNGIIIGRYNEEEDDKLDSKLKELFN